MIHLDTHVVVWLYAGEHRRLPDTLTTRLETERAAISPIVRVELALLHEIGRLAHPPAMVLGELERAIGLAVDGTPFSDVVVAADHLGFTRDPFDRLIAAQAVAADVDLATRDDTLLRHVTRAVWS